jgi:putative Holliday junction resolvase
VRNIPIFLWDERLSTLAVKRGMIDADLSREKQKKNVDKLAAAYILQGLLDRLRAN